MEREYHLREREKSNHEGYLSRLLSPLGIKDQSTFLDLGCGSGYVNDYVESRGNLRLNLGLDLDLGALQLARELNPHAGRVLWACASAEAIPLPDSSVDHIVCRGVVPLASVNRVLADTARILRPGGTAVFLLHNWTFYLRSLSLHARHWKRTFSGLAITLLGLWFNLTGQQIQPRLGRHRFTQTFQTEFRIRRLLRKYGMSVYRVERESEFLIYARSHQNRRFRLGG